jgi:hypothetical protein
MSDLKKLLFVVMLSLVAGGISFQWMKYSGLTSYAACACVFIVPSSLLGFMYRGAVGLIPACAIIAAMLYLLHWNLSQV